MSQLSEEDAASVRAWLRRNQFENVAATGGDSAAIGDRQEIWERDSTLIRLTRDRGQWFYDLSRTGTSHWLDLDGVAGALGSKLTDPVERVAYVATIDDRKFNAVSNVVRRVP